MDIIYKINFYSGHYYIGKLSHEDVLDEHTNGYCKDTPSFKATGERMGGDEVRNTGMKNQKTVRSIQYGPVEQIKQKILSSGLPESAYEALKIAGGKPDKETCEALCIILSKKDGKNIGQVVDFLQKSNDDGKAYFTEQEFNRRMVAQLNEYRLISGLILNFKNRKKPIVDDATDTIKNIIKNATNNRFDVHITRSPELAKAITLKITEKTIPDLVRQIRDKAKKEPYLATYINDIANKLEETAHTSNGKTKDITYGKLFSELYKYIDENNGTQLDIIRSQADPEKMSAILTNWMNSTFLTQILTPYSGEYFLFEDSKFYKETAKNRFTKYIQNKIFNYSPDEEYYAGREEKGEEKRFKYQPGKFFRTYKNEPDMPSLKQKSFDKIPNGFTFLQDNGNEIYPEQVAYYLTKKAQHPFNYNFGNGGHGFISSIDNVTDINYY